MAFFNRVSIVGFGKKIPAAIATPEALSSVSLHVTEVTIKAFRDRVVNTGNVYLGPVGGANDSQTYPLVPGGELKLVASPGQTIDLADILVDAVTLGDGVQLAYIKASS